MHILVAIDGSPAALQACRLAAAHAGDRASIAVTLMNVQRPPLRLLPPAGLPQPMLEQALIEQGQRALDAARAWFDAGWGDVRTVVRIGSPADTLLTEAQALRPSLLLMGGGRPGPVGGYRIGSVALRTAPAAPCPVVLVRADARLPAALGRHLRVTMAVDGSPEALRAVQRLVALAPLLGSLHVDLVHFHPGLTLFEAIAPPHDDVAEQWTGLEHDGALAEAAALLAASGIDHERHRATGSPGADLAAFASRQQADLIALGTRGHGAMHHLVMGSVALSTAHDSDVPVAFLR